MSDQCCCVVFVLMIFIKYSCKWLTHVAESEWFNCAGGFGTGYGSSNGGGAIKSAGGYAQRSAGPYAGTHRFRFIIRPIIVSFCRDDLMNL